MDFNDSSRSYINRREIFDLLISFSIECKIGRFSEITTLFVKFFFSAQFSELFAVTRFQFPRRYYSTNLGIIYFLEKELSHYCV